MPLVTPPHEKISILQHLVNAYKLWHDLRQHIPKSSKYTLGEKIDALFIDVIELILAAQYLKREQKLPILQKANTQFDALKFFLQILWETKDFPTKHYGLLSEHLSSVGKMLGGWLYQLEH